VFFVIFVDEGVLMGKRGEGWFILQIVLFVIIFLVPAFAPFQFPIELRAFGLLALLIGGAMGTLGLLNLGVNLSPFPKPIEGGQLVTHGAYRFARHPIYAGLILGTLGWGLLMATLLGVVFAVVLFVFFDLKSRREEEWLTQAYPGYSEYQRRVRKLIPWVY
jgi:protein-S-isoprenylcysteine O-methyltransferase Ste14